MKYLLYYQTALAVALALPACTTECTGSIETTVLFAKPGPKGVGRNIYVDVVNHPALGSKRTLLYEGKEFGTFPHVVIIHDPTNQYAANRSICFSRFRPVAAPAGGDLTEEGIAHIVVEK